MKGYIYILTNPSFPQYVKIGYATDVEKRIKDLNDSSAVPFSFQRYATLEVDVERADIYIHDLIDGLNPGLRSVEKKENGKRLRRREFFKMEPEDALKVLEPISRLTKGVLCLYNEKNESENKEAESARTQYDKTLEQRYSFWTQFLEYAGCNKEFASIYRRHTPSKEHWMDFGSGNPNASISLTINVRHGHVGVEFYIPKEKKLFERLLSQRDKIETELGFKMDWQPLEEKDASRIIITNALGDFRDFSDAERKEAFDWMIEKMLMVRSVFSKHCK